jgi:GTP cyclohydrolase I
MDYTCRFIGSINSHSKVDLVSEITVPISSVCPCSREISDEGAHNQRGKVCLSIRFNKFIWIEDMIELVERAASCDIYSVLKRSDEKFITERGYANPKFVEDVVRDVALALKEDSNITWFSVEVESYESIHNHNAYAYITSGEQPKI